MKYPEGNGEKIDELDTVDLDPVVNTELKVHFGKNCNDDQKVCFISAFSIDNA